MNLQQAQLLTQKVLAGQAGAEEKAALQQFLTQHALAEELPESLLPVQELETIEAGTLPAGMEERIFRSITGNAPVIPAAAPKTGVLRKLLRITAAAAVVIALGMATYRLFMASNIRPSQLVVVQDTITTKAGHSSYVTLPDGTHIRLNGASTLRFPHSFTGDSRIVYLDGEAFFEVAENAARPFIIQSPAFTTRVLGTSFNVKSRTSNLQQSEVSVATGKVCVNTVTSITADSVVILTPGEKTDFRAGTFKKAFADVHTIGAWKEHCFYYTQTPLSEILNDIHTCYGISFRIKTPAVLSCTYSTTFKHMTPEQIMQTLSLMSDVTFTKKGSVIEVAGRSCN